MIPFHLKELIETESNYVHALDIILACEKTIETLLRREDGKLIFSHINYFHRLHSALQSDLFRVEHNYLNEANGKSSPLPLRISACFLNNKDKFLRYADYYKALNTIESLSDDMNSVQLDDGAEYKLKDLLSLPIQRILKYHHLLEQLLENKGNFISDDFSGLKRALETMRDLARHINQVKCDIDVIKIIDEIQESIGLPDMKLTDYGRLVHDDYIRIRIPQAESRGSKNRPAKHDVKRYVFVFDKVILVCKASGVRRYQFKKALALSDYELETNPSLDGNSSPFAFNLIDINDKITTISFYVKTFDLKNKWVEAIQKAMDNNKPVAVTNHQFDMCTFDRPSYCDHCNKLLLGLYYQGYRCRTCFMSAHKKCLNSMKICRSSENSAPTELDSYMNLRLEDYPWFHGVMKRDIAQALLKNLPNGTFLVRVSPTLTKKASSTDFFNHQHGNKTNSQESYVISLAHNSQVKHMRIYISADNQLYLSQNRSFRSLVELVCWYEKNSLVESFHLLDSRLMIPYKYPLKQQPIESSYEYCECDDEIPFPSTSSTTTRTTAVHHASVS